MNNIYFYFQLFTRRAHPLLSYGIQGFVCYSWSYFLTAIEMSYFFTIIGPNVVRIFGILEPPGHMPGIRPNFSLNGTLQMPWGESRGIYLWLRPQHLMSNLQVNGVKVLKGKIVLNTSSCSVYSFLRAGGWCQKPRWPCLSVPLVASCRNSGPSLTFFLLVWQTLQRTRLIVSTCKSILSCPTHFQSTLASGLDNPTAACSSPSGSQNVFQGPVGVQGPFHGVFKAFAFLVTYLFKSTFPYTSTTY